MKIKKYFVLVLTICAFACTDLSEEPYDQLLPPDLDSSPEILQALAAPAYTSLNDVFFGWHGYFDLQEESADVIVTPARPNGWVDGGTYRALHMHEWNSLQSQPGSLWSRSYAAIKIINDNIGSFKLLENSESVVAELRTLRAFYYYLLMDSFGNIPVTTEEESGIDGFVPEQLPRAQVFSFIVNEIEESLPSLNKEKVYGQMNYWAARMILAKLFLNAKVYINEEKWDDAIVQVNDVIDNGGYALTPTYFDNFETENQNSTEQIFSVVYDEVRSGWLHYHWKTLHPASQATYDLGTQPWGGSCAIPQFIDTYDPNDARLGIWIKGPQFSSAGLPIYNSIDPALSTVQLNYTKDIDGNIDATKEYEGYRVGKFEIEEGTLGPLSNDLPVFRLADAMMIKAECLLRKGESDAAADIVTALRQRNFASASDAEVTGAELLQGSVYNYGKYENGEVISPEGGDNIAYGRFLDELGYEFAAEFHRRQDLIRFGVFTSKSWFSHVPKGDHKIIFDIPQSALDANPKLSHNPGYLP